MNCICSEIHAIADGLERHSFPYAIDEIPSNGVYLLFERGELAHGGDRIVCVGTHTGQGNLQSRLKEHFHTENKDRSIFRKNIGRSLLNKRDDAFIAYWDICLTSRKAKGQHFGEIDIDYQKSVEREVSEYIRSNVSFCVIPKGVSTKAERVIMKRALIYAISLCPDCTHSLQWLGLNSTKPKIICSGLWQEMGVKRRAEA